MKSSSRGCAMTSREFFVERRKAELPVFMRVLQSIPVDRLNYKPHERSPSAEQLIWTLASELRACVEIAENGCTEWRQEPAPPLGEMLERFENWSRELIHLVERMNESAWERIAQFFYQGKVISEQPAGEFLWFILFDAIHHRGQLAAYLRPMGGTVPSIYGPSADSRSGT